MSICKKIDEEQLCKDYLNENIGTEKLAEIYHIGKKRVRQILAEHGVERKKRGGQTLNVEYKVPDWKIVKYPEIEGKHYIAVDKLSGFTTNDTENKAGVLTTYIEKQYGVKTPTLYDRRQYYMKTGDYWWEQWFEIKLVDDAEIKKCPYCDWTTVDIHNRSGMFETHLNKVHGISKLEYLERFPEERDYFATVNRVNNRQMETDEDNFVVCKVCGKKLARIDGTHLRNHGLTKFQYIKLYGRDDMLCNKTYKTLSSIAIETNKNMTHSFSSKAENEIMEKIKERGLFCYTDRKILEGKEIDIYIPSKNIGIEYDGLKWHSEFFGGKNSKYHLKKLEECNKKGVKLITVFEDEYELHKDIVLNKIFHILNLKTSDKEHIFARKCLTGEISSSECRDFLDKNHIQGFVSSTLYIGAFYENRLIGVMSFLQSKRKWELTRFATDINTVCCGVGGKLFKYFVRNYDFDEIKSFADRRWTVDYKDNIYTKLGFEFSGFTPPSYTYNCSSVDRFKRFHKFAFRRSKLLMRHPELDPDMTEVEMAKSLGYDRIWDCGLIKYVYKKKENNK